MMIKSIYDNPYIDEEAKKVISLFDNLYTETVLFTAIMYPLNALQIYI
jgi:hypothetical protein